VLSEVIEILDVQRGQGKLVDQAAGGDPGVMDRAGSTATFGERGKLGPISGKQPRCHAAPRTHPASAVGVPGDVVPSCVPRPIW
jgi:hypothetical protein